MTEGERLKLARARSEALAVDLGATAAGAFTVDQALLDALAALGWAIVWDLCFADLESAA